MKINEIILPDNTDCEIEAAGVGKIVKGVNTTADVKPGETERQAKKFFGGNTRLVPIDATIECIPNRMLFFPSYIQHEVTTLKCKQNIPYGYGRFGITHFYNWESKP